jgi:hypothetical protein
MQCHVVSWKSVTMISLSVSLPDCGLPLSTIGSLPCLIITPFSIGLAKISAGPTNSYISSWPFMCGVFTTLKTKAVCTSEMSVYFHETTRCYTLENCHLHGIKILTFLILWYYLYVTNSQRTWVKEGCKSIINCSELSSGLYCRVKWLSTDVSEVRTASIIRNE